MESTPLQYDTIVLTLDTLIGFALSPHLSESRVMQLFEPSFSISGFVNLEDFARKDGVSVFLFASDSLACLFANLTNNIWFKCIVKFDTYKTLTKEFIIIFMLHLLVKNYTFRSIFHSKDFHFTISFSLLEQCLAKQKSSINFH